jgi:hypothetical protein
MVVIDHAIWLIRREDSLFFTMYFLDDIQILLIEVIRVMKHSQIFWKIVLAIAL